MNQTVHYIQFTINHQQKKSVLLSQVKPFMASLLCEIIVAICDQQKKDLSIEIEADWNFVLVHSLHTHDAIQIQFVKAHKLR